MKRLWVLGAALSLAGCGHGAIDLTVEAVGASGPLRVPEDIDRLDVLVARRPLAQMYQYRHVYVLWAQGRVGEADRASARAFALWPRHPGV